MRRFGARGAAERLLVTPKGFSVLSLAQANDARRRRCGIYRRMFGGEKPVRSSLTVDRWG